MWHLLGNCGVLSNLHTSSSADYRDILSSDFSEVQLKAVVTNFDKRHAGSKYYVSALSVGVDLFGGHAH